MKNKTKWFAHSEQINNVSFFRINGGTDKDGSFLCIIRDFSERIFSRLYEIATRANVEFIVPMPVLDMSAAESFFSSVASIPPRYEDNLVLSDSLRQDNVLNLNQDDSAICEQIVWCC